RSVDGQDPRLGPECARNVCNRAVDGTSAGWEGRRVWNLTLRARPDRGLSRVSGPQRSGVSWSAGAAFAVQVGHRCLRVAGAPGCTRWHQRGDLVQISSTESEVAGTEHGLHLAGAAGTDDRDDVLALGGDPRDRQLCQRGAASVGNLLQGCDQSPVVRQVLALEPGEHRPVADRGTPPEQTFAEHPVGGDPDAELPAGLQDLVALDVPG